MSVLATTTDPSGRRVELLTERWQHITTRHPEIANEQEAILGAVNQPTKQAPGRAATEEQWYYLADAGPSRWLKVVVTYEGDVGSVITAFPRRAFP